MRFLYGCFLATPCRAESSLH